MSPPLIATLLYLAVFILMVTLGVALQFGHPQFGLLASELLCILAPAIVVARLMRKRDDAPALLDVKTWGLSVNWTAWLIVASLLLAVSANAASALFTELVPGLSEMAENHEALVTKLLYPESISARIAAVTAIVVMAPLCEETLFRGVMLPLHSARRMPVGLLLFINGMLFSLLHLNPVTFPALVVVGAFFAHVALLTRSLWPCVVAHATLNFMNGVVGMEAMRTYPALDEPTLEALAVSSVVLGAAFVLSWFVGARGLRAAGTADA